jgi:hypothetical protein
VPYTGSRQVDVVGAVLSVLGMGGVVLGIWCGKKAARRSARFLRSGPPRSRRWRGGGSGQLLPQIGLGGTVIALPIYPQIVLDYSAMGAALSIAPLSLSMFTVAPLAGKNAGKRARRASPRPGSRWSPPD